jgi:hypothetical protein
VGECLINAAVFGTGIAELTLEEVKDMRPSSRPTMDGQLQEIGVEISDRTVCRLRSVLPQNFLIDPVATSVDDAIGVAIDEFVPVHQVEMLQEKGVYKDVPFNFAYPDIDLDADHELTTQPTDKVRLTKYYGLVPRHLLTKDDDYEEVDLQDEDDSFYVEAIVVIANGGTLLKAEKNPYMMQDRPIVAFPWDVVPSRFWGRGVCEKGL